MKNQLNTVKITFYQGIFMRIVTIPVTFEFFQFQYLIIIVNNKGSKSYFILYILYQEF